MPSLVVNLSNLDLFLNFTLLSTINIYNVHHHPVWSVVSVQNAARSGNVGCSMTTIYWFISKAAAGQIKSTISCMIAVREKRGSTTMNISVDVKLHLHGLLIYFPLSFLVLLYPKSANSVKSKLSVYHLL